MSQVFKVFKTSIATNNDISAKIYEISSITYRQNDNWSFELPELTFMSTLDIGIGTSIYIQSVSDSKQQIHFYVDKQTYVYDRKMYSYRCAHVFMKLAEIKTTEIPGGLDIGNAVDWCDITPTLQEYNRHIGSTETTAWNRQYYSCIFLIWIMIRKVTGVSIANLDADAIYDVNSIYTVRNMAGGFYQNFHQPYKRLGLGLANVFYMGMENSDQAGSDDYWMRRSLPSMLDLMQYICMATGIVINIFRSDYALSAFVNEDVPANGAIKSQTDDTLLPYKEFRVSAKRLDGGTADYIFGYYDQFGVLQRYTFGVDNPDRSIGTYEAKHQVAEVTTDKVLSVSFPTFFRIYSIVGTPPASNSNFFAITNEEDGTDELDQLVSAYATYWGSKGAKNQYLSGVDEFSKYVPMVEYNIAEKKCIRERLV